MSVKSEVSNWKCSTFLENKNYKFSRNDILNILTEEDIDTIKLLDELYSSKQLQYIVTGAKTFPVFGPIETVTRKLLFAVGYEVGFPPRDIGNVI